MRQVLAAQTVIATMIDRQEVPWGRLFGPQFTHIVAHVVIHVGAYAVVHVIVHVVVRVVVHFGDLVDVHGIVHVRACHCEFCCTCPS